ncbi:MAG: DM13 domain-containing protein [Actinomycetota bacterium]
MHHLKRYKWLILGVGAIMVIVAFLAFRPDKLFVDDVVDESLSDAFATESVATTPNTEATPATPTTTLTDSVSVTSTTANAPTTTSTTTTTQPPPSVPTAVTTGEFFGIDHSAEGTATVYEQDGRYVLRFEDDTDIQNGPDLYVWVLADDGYEGGTPSEYIDLGKLKGNVGGQNYELPPEFDPAIHRAVFIWCERFSSPFAAAPLA